MFLILLWSGMIEQQQLGNKAILLSCVGKLISTFQPSSHAHAHLKAARACSSTVLQHSYQAVPGVNCWAAQSLTISDQPSSGPQGKVLDGPQIGGCSRPWAVKPLQGEIKKLPERKIPLLLSRCQITHFLLWKKIKFIVVMVAQLWIYQKAPLNYTISRLILRYMNYTSKLFLK